MNEGRDFLQFVGFVVLVCLVVWRLNSTCDILDSTPVCYAKIQQEKKDKEKILATCDKPTKFSEAPDGTILWVINQDYQCPGHKVYFSSGGTSYDERSGKSTIEVNVPNRK